MRMLMRMGGKWETLRKLVGMFRDRYSTSEVHTGSPDTSDAEIYRKVLAVAAGPNAGTVNAAHGVATLDNIIRIWGVLRSGTTERMINSDDGTVLLSAHRDGANIVLTSGSDLSAYAGEVVVEYTKS